uniref:ImmA/IrrE family metallo-endopeptidase n=1 Tax=Methylobacterium flocculans TaxID=2984843 RepID=UPI0021F377DF|nr:ImmA/IrrE family metallo-endopeptidase [Methylobacterium sp. FF17]
MFSDRRATFRSDEIVERDANLVRQWGQISGHSKFNVVHLIEGALRKHLPLPLDINFIDPRLDGVEAFVEFDRKVDRASLFVRRSVWVLAEANHDLSRFILAHEIGHLKMHRHDALGFPRYGKSALSDLQEQERAEPQADKFADCLLVKEDLLLGFSEEEEIAFMFDVPINCARRRLQIVQDKARRRSARHTGEACPECANFTLVHHGPCLKCDTCGGTMGYF